MGLEKKSGLAYSSKCRPVANDRYNHVTSIEIVIIIIIIIIIIISSFCIYSFPMLISV